jgi:hypothetical protein
MKKYYFFLLFIICTLQAAGQINTTPDNRPVTKNKYKPKGGGISSGEKFFKKENIIVGGGFGMSFGNRFISVGIAPEASYFLIPLRLSLGARFNYNFYKDNLYDIKSHLYGGGPFVRGYIWRGLFAQAEYELSSVEVLLIDMGTTGPVVVGKRRIGLNAFLIGAGYHQNFDGGFGFYIQLLYNVLQSTDFIYPNPMFRMGFTYSFRK